MFRKLISLLLFIGSAQGVLAQRVYKPHAITEAEQAAAERDNICFHRDTYTATQRLSFYPFNKAALVKLVAYNGGGEANVQTRIDSTGRELEAPTPTRWTDPFNDNKIDPSQYIEAKRLTKLQISKLTDILYNIGVRVPNSTPIPGYKCFSPRNGIIFIDANGTTFAYIEICFECEDIRLSADEMQLGDFYCGDKFKMLKAYFASAGIKYGIDRAYTSKFERPAPDK